MALMPFIEEADASPEVKAVYDDIKATRKVDWINNFWKVLANDPKTLKRTWEDLKQVMGPGTLDPVVKEMLYLAVSMTNSCEYCIVSHTAAARKAGMNDAMLAELVSVVGMANATNRMVNAYRTEPDPKLIEAAKGGKK
ncbi:MAG TPA: carboxymuconolactone decarboxylase family protein [Dongiaceae bacterium]|jgi:AhpD family alkylhydroperoxidase|nr:carboxymuconolactone decarboxylase family protein [Dongiaceae bacterium]